MLRLATIGTNWITKSLAEAAKASGRAEVTAVHSRSLDRAREFAAAIGGVAQPFDDLDRLLAAPDVDAVYVASPNAAHADQVARCLEAGKHVLCEKPLTPTEAETTRLFELADTRRLVLLEAMRSAYDPGMQAVRDLIATLGPIRRVSFRMIQRSSRYDQVLAGERTNIFDPALGGGALLDIGVYCAHPLVSLFGEPTEVYGGQVLLTTGADGAGAVLAVYPTFVADLSYSKITASPLPSEICGELGTLQIDQIAQPRLLVAEYLDGRREEHRIDGAANNLVYEVVRFADLVEQGLRPEAETRDSLLTARLIDRARQPR